VSLVATTAGGAVSGARLWHGGHWLRLREEVIAETGCRCERCGVSCKSERFKHERAAYLHHVTYERAG
jgi:hypothetical protein